MNRINQSAEPIDAARETSDLRRMASGAQPELRPLKELEMGWVAGGDGMPVWPY